MGYLGNLNRLLRKNKVNIHCAPHHMGILDNEQAEELTKWVASTKLIESELFNGVEIIGKSILSNKRQDKERQNLLSRNLIRQVEFLYRDAINNLNHLNIPLQ